jgi:hypothetical protein
MMRARKPFPLGETRLALSVNSNMAWPSMIQSVYVNKEKRNDSNE